MLVIRLLLLLFLSLLSFDQRKYEPENAEKKDIEIIVFIHGGISLGPTVPITHFNTFLQDQIQSTVYEKVVQEVRSDPFFYQNQPIQQIGLTAITPEKIKRGYAAGAIIQSYETIFSWSLDKERIRCYYTYGWSGHFSKKRRNIEAQKLYQALIEVVDTCKNQGYNPVIHLIGYCHGAHIIAELGHISKKYTSLPFFIDQATLIAMPIAPDTVRLLSESIFKNIYHIYSRKDRVQPIDIFVTRKLITGHTIKTHDPRLLKKLTQIEIKIKKIKKNTLKKNVDFNQKKHSIGSRSYWQDISPGHIEFWFFGWTPNNYRKDHLLYPLPFITFLPSIFNVLQRDIFNFDRKKPIIFDFRPEFEKMIVRQYDSRAKKWNIQQKPFLKIGQLKELKKITFSFAPQKYQTTAEYNQQIKLAYHNVINKN